MVAAALIGSFLLLLFLVWKIRYRYPPAGLPQALCYHKLSRRFLFEGTWTTPDRFRAQMKRLEAYGYVFVAEDEFMRQIEDPSTVGERNLLLTFDDGYEELYEACMNHLVPRQIPVLIFLVADFAGCTNGWDLSLGRRPRRHLSWEQIRELGRHGVRFGSHGATHVDLPKLSNGALEREVLGSKQTSEEKTGLEVRSFSYPFGRYDARARSVSRTRTRRSIVSHSAETEST